MAAKRSNFDRNLGRVGGVLSILVTAISLVGAVKGLRSSERKSTESRRDENEPSRFSPSTDYVPTRAMEAKPIAYTPANVPTIGVPKVRKVYPDLRVSRKPPKFLYRAGFLAALFLCGMLAGFLFLSLSR
jgi:hypothetical protein